jgi:Dolichyl-phosphate-mannose-protein mannosyltransferase
VKKWIVCVWCCFVLRGLFYCSALPLWEGFDEWAHMGVVEHMRVAGAVVVDRQSLISEEIYASLLLAPMPRGMTNIPPGGVSHQEYWSLPPSEREARQRRLHKLPPDLARVASTAGMPAYEASQPPLFYAIVAGLLTPLGGASLLTRVWAARCITVLIASVTIPIAYRVFINVWNDDRLALSGISLIAAAPGFVLNQARVSNESLGVLVFTFLLWAQLQAWRNLSISSAITLGTACGIGLLTKAYFLTTLPAILAIYVFQAFKMQLRRSEVLQHASVTFSIAVAIGGWWYVRTLYQTGTLSGLDEALMVRGMPFSERMIGLFEVRWIHAVATVLLSHIWYGGWSLLALPRWMYYVAFSVVGTAFAGMVRAPINKLCNAIVPMFVQYVFFWIGLLYQIWMLFLSKGSSTAMGGWYLHAAIVAEVILLFQGLSRVTRPSFRYWILPVLTFGLAALDLYGLLWVSFPHYVQTFDLFSIGLSRLVQDKPDFLSRPVLAVQWVGFPLATFGLLIVSAAIGRGWRPSRDANTNC